MTRSADRTQLTFTPSAALPAGATVTVNLTGVVSDEGVSLANSSWTFATRSATTTIEESMFGDQVPATTSVDDSSPVEVGVAFTPSRSGDVTGIRFFKGAGNTGAHTGAVWSASGTKLASVSFVGETSSGWQTAWLTNPLAVQAGTSYVVSYYAPRGHYAATTAFFGDDWVRGSLKASAGGNGRYRYAEGGGFPTSSWNATNYFVDVVFERAQVGVTVASTLPTSGATGVSADVVPRIDFSEAVNQTGWSMTLSQGGSTVPGSASISADRRRLVFQPAAALAPSTSYTVRVQGVTSGDGVVLDPQVWTFTTAAATTQTVNLMGDLAPSADAQDNDALELGTAFAPSVAGVVTGVRFYKGTGNTGVHTGSLWGPDGTRLATVTFTGETASGWQSAQFDTPVAVTAGTVYVVSYYSPTGRFSYTTQYFSEPRTSGPLTAPAGANGRYRYGIGGGYPTGSWNSTNYFVDVLFRSSP